eukprot:6492148-Amphidinium_carterae.2
MNSGGTYLSTLCSKIGNEMQIGHIVPTRSINLSTVHERLRCLRAATCSSTKLSAPEFVSLAPSTMVIRLLLGSRVSSFALPLRSRTQNDAMLPAAKPHNSPANRQTTPVNKQVGQLSTTQRHSHSNRERANNTAGKAGAVDSNSRANRASLIWTMKSFRCSGVCNAHLCAKHLPCAFWALDYNCQ